MRSVRTETRYDRGQDGGKVTLTPMSDRPDDAIHSLQFERAIHGGPLAVRFLGIACTFKQRQRKPHANVTF